MINKIKFALNIFGDVTTTTSISADIQTFYDKALFELASPCLVHEQFAQKRKLPKNSGSTIEFRAFSSLPKITKALTEGVTPSGSSLNVKTITSTPEAYGDYIQLSDVLETDYIDNIVLEATKTLADQAGRTLDTIVRNELNGGTNVMYSPKVMYGDEFPVTSRLELDQFSSLTVKDIFKAVTELKAMNAPTIKGNYVGIIHPYASHDLIQNAGESWKTVTEYASPEERFIGEIGMVAGVRFVESTEAKIFGPEKLIGGKRSLKITTGEVGSTYAVLEDDIPAENFGQMSIYVGEDRFFVTKVTKFADSSRLYFQTPIDISLTGRTAYVGGGTLNGMAVFSTLIMGADAYGVTETEGGIENIIKQKGSGNDPLNQRSTIGWKARKCAQRLVEEHLIRIESTNTFSNTAMGN